MSDNPTSPDDVDLHADKYNDPRVKITKRGLLMGVGVVLFGVVGAAASIYGRRTQVAETTRFWGEETITGLRLGERIEMLPKLGESFAPVDLTGMPNLGHLRRTLLDDRNYDWTTENEQTVVEKSRQAAEPNCVTLKITDPTGKRVGTLELEVDLVGGWVGPANGRKCVRLTDRKRSGLKHFLITIRDFEPLRADSGD